jgi:hypothetical protein
MVIATDDSGLEGNSQRPGPGASFADCVLVLGTGLGPGGWPKRQQCVEKDSPNIAIVDNCFRQTWHMANLGTTSVGSLTCLTDKDGPNGLLVMRYLGKLDHGHGEADSSSHGRKEAVYWF